MFKNSACELQELPRGHPDCLTGRTFVVSGVLDSLQRDQADDLIKRHGGRVTGSVSGKTSFLVVGTNCGRSKLNSVRAISESAATSRVMAVCQADTS